jgi:hypothetical protein
MKDILFVFLWAIGIWCVVGAHSANIRGAATDTTLGFALFGSLCLGSAIVYGG